MIKILLVMMLLFSAITKAEGSSSDSFDFESTSDSSSYSSSDSSSDSSSASSSALSSDSSSASSSASSSDSSSASSSDSSSNEISRSDSDNSVAIKDLTYWEAIEYFGLTPVFTLFPGPNSPVSEPTVFIGIASFDSFLQKVEEEVARMN